MLLALLGVGLLLRLWFVLVWRPAITGYSDSGIYFQGAVDSLWSDPLRTVGYSMFLRVLHALSPHLILVVIVQHMLGLATAVLLFLAVRRGGGPRWLGLLPAAVVVLGGDQLFLEHAALSDALFTFLLAGMLFCAIRAASGGLGWAILTGLLAGLALWDRQAAIGLAPVIALWLVFCAGRPTRRTATAGLVALAVAAGTIGGYVEWRHQASGLSGITTNSSWNLYGRMAPWADCSKFTPPSGTEPLCEALPPSERGFRSSEDYIYGPHAPQWMLGPPYLVSRDPHGMQRLRRFALAALTGQPLDYLRAVGLDLVRLVAPNARSYGDLSADQLIAFMLYGPDSHSGRNDFVRYWQDLLYPADAREHRGAIGPLKDWERLTRIKGPVMALLLLLCLASPWLVPRGHRAAATLFAAVTLVVLLLPILTKSYDYRFVIPAFGPLVAVGAWSGWGLWARLPRVSSP